MVWYSRVGYRVCDGMLWYGMVWYGIVGYGRYGMVRYGMAWYGMVILLVVPMELRGTLTRDNEKHQPVDHKLQKCWSQNNKTVPTSS